MSPDEKARRIQELKTRIADLEARLPAHSVPVAMLVELEELEEKLAGLEAAQPPASEERHGVRSGGRPVKEESPAIELSTDEQALIQRLRRIEGQMRGLQRMVSERRDCHDTITQLLAARSALDQAGLMLLNNYLDRCLPQANGAPANIDLAALRRTLNLWTRFGS
jgi:DNA-binding FrmR family transcriptional regulator